MDPKIIHILAIVEGHKNAKFVFYKVFIKYKRHWYHEVIRLDDLEYCIKKERIPKDFCICENPFVHNPQCPVGNQN